MACLCGCGQQPVYKSAQFVRGHHMRLRPKPEPLPAVPPQFCACGCGQVTRVATKNDRWAKQTKGVRLKYVPRHQWRNRPQVHVVGRYPKRGRRNAHIVIAETVIGKPLPKGAEVHHVDGDGYNNAHANLVICQDSAYHKLLHVRARVLKAGGDPNTHKAARNRRKVVAA